MFSESLYELKRRFGVKVSIHRSQSETIDYAVGTKTISQELIEISKAILLPTSVSPKSFIQSPGFQFGGFIDINTRILIIDARDVPKTLVLTNEDYLVINHERFNIETVQLHESQAYTLTLKRAAGVIPNEIIDRKITSWLKLTQEVSYEF